ncbi:helicase-related protein, partial [Anaerotruncus colihominis]|uniref:helicase-related protein n=1 Tax=Anaerotruncus colihominis TaxID=169435 RepID=UPI00210C0546
DPVKVADTPVSSPVEAIEQRLYFVDKPNKRRLLIYLLEDVSIVSALVFTFTKHGADRVARELVKAGIKAQAIHGENSQGARQRALSAFKNGDIRVLVATDIA